MSHFEIDAYRVTPTEASDLNCLWAVYVQNMAQMLRICKGFYIFMWCNIALLNEIIIKGIKVNLKAETMWNMVRGLCSNQVGFAKFSLRCLKIMKILQDLLIIIYFNCAGFGQQVTITNLPVVNVNCIRHSASKWRYMTTVLPDRLASVDRRGFPCSP